MPPVSEAQRRAMFAAKAGHSTLGIPKSVGKEFAEADPGGHLPEKKGDAGAVSFSSGGRTGYNISAGGDEQPFAPGQYGPATSGSMLTPPVEAARDPYPGEDIMSEDGIGEMAQHAAETIESHRGDAARDYTPPNGMIPTLENFRKGTKFDPDYKGSYPKWGARDDHESFGERENELAHRKDVHDPAALAAYIGREKYGKAGMEKKAEAGRGDAAPADVQSGTATPRQTAPEYVQPRDRRSYDAPQTPEYKPATELSLGDLNKRNKAYWDRDRFGDCDPSPFPADYPTGPSR